MSSQTQYYHHGTFNFAGGTIPDAVTAYRTYGDPSNPCIVYPTFFGQKLDNLLYLIGENNAFDPKKYYIVTFALFSNGESSSPSNTPAPHNGPNFPRVIYDDNVRAQYAVLTKELGVKKIFSVAGFSMGGSMGYYWALMYPDFVERFVCICGSARTSPHNKIALQGPRAALLASKDYEGGHYKSTPEHGIRAFGRSFGAWVYGQTWFREHLYLHKGLFDFPDQEYFTKAVWEDSFLSRWDANDLIFLLNTWHDGDISLVRDGGDLAKALGSIKAKALILPIKTDLLFPPEDSEIEVSHLKHGKLVVIPSIWGHMGASGFNPTDTQLVKEQITAFFA